MFFLLQYSLTFCYPRKVTGSLGQRLRHLLTGLVSWFPHHAVIQTALLFLCVCVSACTCTRKYVYVHMWYTWMWVCVWRPEINLPSHPSIVHLSYSESLVVLKLVTWARQTAESQLSVPCHPPSAGVVNKWHHSCLLPVGSGVDSNPHAPAPKASTPLMTHLSSSILHWEFLFRNTVNTKRNGKL